MNRISDTALCRIVHTILDKIFALDNGSSSFEISLNSMTAGSQPKLSALKASPNGSSNAIGVDSGLEMKKKEMTPDPNDLNEMSDVAVSQTIGKLKILTRNASTVDSGVSVIRKTGLVDSSNAYPSSPSKRNLADGTTFFKINSTDKAALYDVPKEYDENFDDLCRATAGVNATINILPKMMKNPLPENQEFATLEIEKSNRNDLLQGSGHSRVTTVRPMAAHSTPFKCVTRDTSEIEAPAKRGHILKNRPKRARIENTPEFNFLKTLFVKDAEKYEEYLLKEKLCRANESANKDVKEYRVVKKLRDWVGQDSYKKFQDHGYFRSKQNAAVEFIDFALNWVNKNVNQTHRVRVSRLVTFIGDMVIGGDVIAISDCTSFGTLFRLDKYTAESDFKDYVACHIHGVVA
ncbi:unnamed protein product [Caenorhabditis nigoni]